MAGVQQPTSPDLMKFSISCFDVPDGLIDKNVSKAYFQQFGKLLRIRLRPKQKSCVVEYFDEESAVRALTESGDFQGFSFRVAWTKVKLVEKKRSRKKSLTNDWAMNSEIQAELEAMRGSFTSNRAFGSQELSPDLPQKREAIKKPKTRLRIEKPKSPKITKMPKIPKVPKQSIQKSTKPELVTSYFDSDEHLKNIMTTALTSEEKFRILDARDKLIRTRTIRQSTLSVKTVGTCPDMCPEKERLMREVQHQVSSYEQFSSHKGSMNHNLAVKQYSRSSADQESPLPHELRPVKVLLLTMGYLLHKIMDLCESDANLAEWYHFLWDRTRGIRKDVTQQELCCLDSVKLVEQCARFHIFCAARLVNEDNSVFDDKINTENLTKCLQTLKYMYHDLRVKHGVVCPNEAEFRAYIVLLNLNDGNFMWEVQQLSLEIQQSPQIKFAISVYSALDKNNYVRFFKLVKSTSLLNACILLRYFNQVRNRALLTILKSYSPRQPYMQYPLVELCRTLAFEDLQSTIEFLEYYNLNINSEKTHVILDKRMYQPPDLPISLDRAINIIESKRQCSVGETVCGASLPPKDFEKHVPHNSFDDNGFLKLSELPVEFQLRYQQFLRSVGTKEIIDLTEDRQKIIKEIGEIDEEIMREEIEEQKNELKIPEFSFESKLNENSQSEIDGTSIFRGPIPPKLHETRSLSPFRSLTNTNEPPQINFWSKPSQNQFSFSSNPKNIFGNDSYVKQIEIKPISVPENIPSFTFTPSENIYTPPENIYIPPKNIYTPENNYTPLENIYTPKSKSKPIVETSTIFKPIWTPEPVKKIENFQENIEKNKEEEQRKELEEFLRKHKEQEAKDEQLRKEKRLQEERKILEIKKQEQLKIDAKIKSEVNFVLQNILNKVEEHLVKTRLTEISENIKKRRALQFVKRWRNITKISRKKRKNFFDNPVWISSKDASSEAKELYTPSQKLTLHDIKRYKRGTPETINILQEKLAESIDVYKIVYRILFERLCAGENMLNLNLFWNIGVSFRNNENSLNSNRLFSSLKNIFEWVESNNENLIVKRSYANNGGSLTYCIKEIKNLNSFSYLNGLIFISSEETLQNSYNRLLKILKNSPPIPVTIIIKDSVNNDKKFIAQQLKLNFLLNNDFVTDFEILFSKENNLELILSSSLKYLALNITSKPNLEMDALPVFLRNCLGEEFWFRINSSCRINDRLNILLRDPNVAIDLHNESLKKALNIIFNDDLLVEPNFPVEFKPFVKQQQILLPCSYEYFPDYWNSKNYLNKVKKVTENLFLPKFGFSWPPNDQCDLQDILEEYCNKIFKDSTCIVLKLLSLLLDKIDLDSNFQNQMSFINWSDVLQTITLEKLSTIQFYDKTHAVYTIVYKSEDLKLFRDIPWWYNTEIIKNKIKFVEIEHFYEPEIITDESEDEIDIDKTFSELKEKEEDHFDEKKQYKHDFNNLTSLLADLEESMEIQQKIMNKFQEKLNNTFDCK